MVDRLLLWFLVALNLHEWEVFLSPSGNLEESVAAHSVATEGSTEEEVLLVVTWPEGYNHTQLMAQADS